MEIILNEAEQRLSKYLAKARHSNARDKLKPDLKKGPQSAEETDLEGIGSEIAACKALNVYPDLETQLDKLPDEDLITKQGYRVDVKATKYRNGKLIAATWKRGKPCDFYLLVIGQFPNYRIAGLMTADELLQDKRVTDLGHGKTFAATQTELQSVDDWLISYG